MTGQELARVREELAKEGCVLCPDCLKVVRLNKFLFGSLHVCVTECERRGHHSGPRFARRRVGPPWNRRNEFRCLDCDEVITVPVGYPVEVVQQP